MPFCRHWWQRYIWKHLAEAEAMSLASFDGASVMAIDIVPWETWSTDTRWPTWQTSFTPSLNCTLSGPRWFGSWWVAYMFEQKIVYIFVGAWYSKCKMDGDPFFVLWRICLKIWCCLGFGAAWQTGESLKKNHSIPKRHLLLPISHFKHTAYKQLISNISSKILLLNYLSNLLSCLKQLPFDSCN